MPVTNFALEAQGLYKSFGKVVALNGVDFELRKDEVLAIIGDNGAGKSTLIKVLCGAVVPDAGEISLFGEKTFFSSPHEARDKGIETVFQDLAVTPSMSIVDNLFLGREVRRKDIMGKLFRTLDYKHMISVAKKHLSELGLLTIQNIMQPVETLSGGQRQGIAVARAAVFGSKLIIMDEPTAALGVKESRRVIDLIHDIKGKGLPIILISHNMPIVFEVSDRIHIQRLGKRVALLNTKESNMSEAVAIMTGARTVKSNSKK